MSHWDFLHPGLPDHGSADTWTGQQHDGHFVTDASGQVHHQDAQGVDHGTTHHDVFGTSHHADSGGSRWGSTHTDAAGHVHHHDAAGREQVHTWLDPMGTAHHMAAQSGVELAQTHLDASGHLQVQHTAHGPVGHSPGAEAFLDRLLRPR